MNKFIEFIGLPGAGKTTLLDYISKENWFKENELHMFKENKNSTAAHKIFISIYLALTNFVLFVSLIVFSKDSDKTILKNIKFVLTFLRLYHAMKNNNKIGFQDQGLLQTLVSLKLPLKNSAPVSVKYMPRIAKIIKSSIQQIIFIEIDIGNSSRRLDKRSVGSKNSRADALSGLERNIFLEDFYSLLGKIIEVYVLELDIPVLYLDGNESLKSKSFKIKNGLTVS